VKVPERLVGPDRHSSDIGARPKLQLGLLLREKAAMRKPFV
jgi:hypothetical protein